MVNWQYLGAIIDGVMTCINLHELNVDAVAIIYMYRLVIVMY